MSTLFSHSLATTLSSDGGIRRPREVRGTTVERVALHPSAAVPGPSVLAAMSQAPRPWSREAADLLVKVGRDLATFVGSAEPAILGLGSGTDGLRTVLGNHFSEGETVVIPTWGIFGNRLVELARELGLEVVELQHRWGAALSLERVAKALQTVPAGLVFCHLESSTGRAARLSEVAALAREVSPDSLLVVDAMPSAPALPISINGLDVVVSTASKALAGPAGLWWCVRSARAAAARAGRRPGIHDLARFEEEQANGRWLHAFPIELLAGLGQAIKLVQTEGLETFQDRHLGLARRLHSGLRRLDLMPSTNVPEGNIVVATLPAGIAAGSLVARLAAVGVDVGRGRGLWADTTLRFATFGQVTELEVANALKRIENIQEKEVQSVSVRSTGESDEA